MDSAVDWLREKLFREYGFSFSDNVFELAKHMEFDLKNKEITDEEFVKIYNQIIKTQHLEGYKNISTDYHLGFLHGLDYLFDFIKRKNDKTNR